MEKQYHELDELLEFLEKNKPRTPRRNLLQKIWDYIRISFDDLTCGL